MIFAGPRADLPALYSAADAFVLPTAYETFSLVCMEAMACGVPVFATAAGGIEEYLKDGVNGFRIRMDAEDIAEKLAAAFANPALMQRLRDGALATASSYGWDRIGQQYIELLREIDTERRGGVERLSPLSVKWNQSPRTPPFSPCGRRWRGRSPRPMRGSLCESKRGERLADANPSPELVCIDRRRCPLPQGARAHQ